MDVGVKRVGKSERIIMAPGNDDDGWDDDKGYESARLRSERVQEWGNYGTEDDNDDVWDVDVKVTKIGTLDGVEECRTLCSRVLQFALRVLMMMVMVGVLCCVLAGNIMQVQGICSIMWHFDHSTLRSFKNLWPPPDSPAWRDVRHTRWQVWTLSAPFFAPCFTHLKWTLQISVRNTTTAAAMARRSQAAERKSPPTERGATTEAATPRRQVSRMSGVMQPPRRWRRCKPCLQKTFHFKMETQLCATMRSFFLDLLLRAGGHRWW